MSLLHFLNVLLAQLAEYWQITLPVLAFFTVACTLRLRQLKRQETKEVRTLQRSEEESVLARRTLDFAHHTGEAPRERSEYHKMPSRDELTAAPTRAG